VTALTSIPPKESSTKRWGKVSAFQLPFGAIAAVQPPKRAAKRRRDGRLKGLIEPRALCACLLWLPQTFRMSNRVDAV
jgi:hypothetical protein